MKTNLYDLLGRKKQQSTTIIIIIQPYDDHHITSSSWYFQICISRPFVLFRLHDVFYWYSHKSPSLDSWRVNIWCFVTKRATAPSISPQDLPSPSLWEEHLPESWWWVLSISLESDWLWLWSKSFGCIISQSIWQNWTLYIMLVLFDNCSW